MDGQDLTVLLDSGASHSLLAIKGLLRKHVTKVSHRKVQDIWQTCGENAYTINSHSTHKFSLPKFFAKKIITWEFFKVKSSKKLNSYDAVISRDLMKILGIDLLFSEGMMTWDNVSVPMVDFNTLEKILKTQNKEINVLYTEQEESPAVQQMINRATKVLDANYKKANIKEYLDEECAELSAKQRQQLEKIITKYEILFGGGLGKWNRDPVSFSLKPNAKLVQSRPFQVHHIHQETLKKEVERLVKIGVLRKNPTARYSIPSFIIPKKDGTVRFVSDFRKVNQILERAPFPTLRIKDLLESLAGFQWVSAIDLNIGYYHIELDPFAQEVCTIVFPWGKYSYNRLPMGISCAPDIFQAEISSLWRNWNLSEFIWMICWSYPKAHMRTISRS